MDQKAKLHVNACCSRQVAVAWVLWRRIGLAGFAHAVCNPAGANSAQCRGPERYPSCSGGWEPMARSHGDDKCSDLPASCLPPLLLPSPIITNPCATATARACASAATSTAAAATATHYSYAYSPSIPITTTRASGVTTTTTTTTTTTANATTIETEFDSVDLVAKSCAISVAPGAFDYYARDNSGTECRRPGCLSTE